MPKKSIREMNILEKFHYSLAARTFHAVLFFAIILGAAAIVFGFFLYTNSINREYRTETWKLAKTAESILEDTKAEEKAGEILSLYLSIPEKERGDGTAEEYLSKFDSLRDDDFEKICEVLRDLSEKNDAVAAYIAAIEPKSNKMIFLVDSDPKESFCRPGSWDVMKAKYIRAFLEGAKENVLDQVLDTYDRIPSVISNMEQYGYRCTAGSELFTEDGHTVMIFMDTDMNHIAGVSRNFLLQYIILMAVLAILVSCLFVRYLKRTIVKPVNELTAAASEYTKEKHTSESTGNYFGGVEIHTGDEIEALSYMLKDMERDMGEYVSNLTAVTAEKERIGTELSLATRIQADMLPNIYPAFPERPEFDIYASMTPAKEVGGDFYDFFLTDEDHLALVMADVSGKGVPAALFMMASKILIKNHTMTGLSPAEVLKTVNDQICANNREEMFVTIWLGILNIKTGVLTAANAGHEYPILQNGDGRFEAVRDKHGFVIGGIAGMTYKNYELKMTPGSRLFVYTDGVTEASDSERNLFGMEQLISSLNRNPSGSPKQIVEELDLVISEYTGDAPQSDDLTILCVQYKGPKENGQSLNNILSSGEITAEAAISSLEKVTEFVNGELGKQNCPRKAQIQIDIAIDEIFSNIAKYAYTEEGQEATVRVEIQKVPKAAVITFIDSGMPFDPMAAEDPDISLPAEERTAGGLGLLIVRKTMDEVQYRYENGCNIMTIKKRFE